MQEEQATRIAQAWAELAGVPRLLSRQVVVRPHSLLGRPGWVAVLGLGDTLTVAVPKATDAARIEGCLARLPQAAVAPEALLSLLGGSEVLGPADLFYPEAVLARAAPPGVLRISTAQLEELKQTLAQDEFDESGLEYADGDLFAEIDDQGRTVGVCGYERWPAGVAHLCIATVADQRRRGVGRRVAQAAVASALREGLLPQWRARLEPSKALARSLGLLRWGFQFSVRW